MFASFSERTALLFYYKIYLKILACFLYFTYLQMESVFILSKSLDIVHSQLHNQPRPYIDVPFIVQTILYNLIAKDFKVKIFLF